jgi:hypothetical protein
MKAEVDRMESKKAATALLQLYEIKQVIQEAKEGTSIIQERQKVQGLGLG